MSCNGLGAVPRTRRHPRRRGPRLPRLQPHLPGRPGRRGRRLHRDPDPRHRRAHLPARAGRPAVPARHPDRRRDRARGPRRARPGRHRGVRLLRPLARAGHAPGLTGHRHRRRLRGARAPGARCCARAARSSPSPPCAPASARARPPATSPGCCSDLGLRVVAVRHPMPYGDLAAQACQRFETYEDLDHARTAPSRSARSTSRTSKPVSSSTRASTTGGSCARPRPRPTSCSGTAATTTCRSTCPTCTSCWPTRCAPATRPAYHPGEANVRMADLVIVAKCDSARPAGHRGRRGVGARAQPTRRRAALRQPGHPRRPGGRAPGGASSSSRTARP